MDMITSNNDNCTFYGDFTDDDLALSFCNDTEIKDLCLNACQILTCKENLNNSDHGGNNFLDTFLEVISKILTFLLLFGFAATVNVKFFFENFKSKGVYIGLLCQFFILPFLGFISVLLFHQKLKPLIMILIIIVTSCPGGAYSNWFCSMFNADLALSVAMTTTSTVLSMIFLPVNILMYVNISLKLNLLDTENKNIVDLLPFADLFGTLGIVIGAVTTGLLYGWKLGDWWQRRANFVGNIAGILLQAIGLVATSTSCAPPWSQPIIVFVATGLPLVLGIVIVLLITRKLSLPKPQQVAIAIECGYQNTGIAVTIALGLGSEGRAATVVPVLYGILEAICYFSFCFFSVYAGWTLSPDPWKTSILKILFNDYQQNIETSPLYANWRKHHRQNAVKDSDDNSDETQVTPNRKITI